MTRAATNLATRAATNLAYVGGGPALDGLPAPLAAWSFDERLLTSFTGSLSRMVETGGSTEANIGYGGDNRCKQIDITTLCGANPGVYRTLYDQSGAERNLTQGTASLRPNGFTGAAIRKVGSNNVCARFDGVDDVLSRVDALGLTGNPALTIVYLGQRVSATTMLCAFGLGGLAGLQSFAGYFDSASTVSTRHNGAFRAFTPSANPNTLHYSVITHAAGADANATVWRQNGVVLAEVSSVADAPSLIDSVTSLGAWLDGTDALNLDFVTWVVWNAVLDAGQISTVESWLEQRRLG